MCGSVFCTVICLVQYDGSFLADAADTALLPDSSERITTDEEVRE